MLLQKITIENFKGINEKQEIDLSVSNKVKEKLKNNLFFKKEDNSLIPLIIGLTGKNASGKTSIIEGIKFIIEVVFSPEELFNNFYSHNIFHDQSNIYHVHVNDIIENEDLKKTIVKNNKLIDDFLNLTFENKKRLFPNEYSKFLESIIDLHSYDKKSPIKIEMFFKNEKDIYGIKLNFKKTNLIYSVYKNNQKIKIEEFPKINFSYLEFDNYNSMNEIASILNLQHKLIELIGYKKYNLILKMIDNNIKEIDRKINNAKKTWFAGLHMNNKTLIPFHHLSTGTIKILKFIAKIMTQNFKSKNKLTIFIADEINTYLHTKLVRFLFILLSKNLSNCQLIFTTHSPGIIENLNRHAVWVIQNENTLKIKKVGSILRENNSYYNKFIAEEISSHPSNFEINEVLYELSKK